MMILVVKTKPSQPQTTLKKVSETEYEAELTEPAEKNRANRQLVNLLAKELTIPHTAITITNPTSSKKRIKIQNNSFK